MPKIIENVRGKLLEEARRQIEERGYKETTVRSVAAALSIGLGTLYNYFESKDMLVASFMLDDWSKSMTEMRESIDSSADSHEKLRLVFEGLRAFSERHKKLFSDPSARKTFAHTMQERHPLLIGQISSIILPIVSDSGVEDKKLLADFISESILTWSASGREYAELAPIFNKLI